MGGSLYAQQTMGGRARLSLALRLALRVSSRSHTEESPTRAVLSGSMGGSTRASTGAQLSKLGSFQNRKQLFVSLHSMSFVFRVDSTGTHVNGEGNYGFCSAECSGAPREFEAVSRFRSSASSSAVSFGGASSSAAARRSRRPF